MKIPILRSLVLAVALFGALGTAFSQAVQASRLKEIFKRTDLKANLQNPWEITYAPDGYLWITEASNYRVVRMNPANGDTTVVLNLQYNATNTQSLSGLSSTEFNNYKRTFTGGETGFKWPQGGMMGMAFHPEFNTNPSKRFVYLAYVRAWVGKQTATTTTATFVDGQGIYYTTMLTKWTYDPTLKKLVSPETILNNIPGSSDHNSGRMIIAPVGGTNYLFYAVGDMGAGQFENNMRIIRAQDATNMQGKILRFNLEGPTWIPTDNPYSSTNPVYSIGIRNNQGFAYAEFGGVGRLFGSSHGPFSDDEINIIEPGKNYGHPLVIGYSGDGNYNGVSAGAIGGSLPIIAASNGEQNNAATIGASYKDPIFSFYNATKATVTSIYNNQTNNNLWPSEAPSGIDIYTGSAIPGWKNSLIMASLKWGRILRLKINATGTGVIPVDGSADSVTYLESGNRYRDVAYSPDGKTIYTVMDQSGASSGPSAMDPIVPACPGCVQAFTFLGYGTDGTGRSNIIPATVDLAPGTANVCEGVNTITVNSDNRSLWIPITDNNGNLVAEIRPDATGSTNASLLNLPITTTFYKNTNAVREDGNRRLFMDRNISISLDPSVTQPLAADVNVRLYFTAAEFTALVNATNSLGVSSGVSSIANLGVFKTTGACADNIAGQASIMAIDYVEAFGSNYVVGFKTKSFSSFYLANNVYTILPISITKMTAQWMGNKGLINWNTLTEESTSQFVVERSTDGRNYTAIGTLKAKGNSQAEQAYSFIDEGLSNLSSAQFYYRLKIEDANGKSQYSKVATLNRGGASFFVKLFPNPAHNSTTLSIFSEQDETVQLQLTDMSGRIMLSKQQQVLKGANNISIDLQPLPAGIYQLKVAGKQFNQQLKVQKQ